jgi:tetratricopeptide (TPR) repeat protein
MKHPFRLSLCAAALGGALVCALVSPAYAVEDLIQARRWCNGERNATADQVIEGCTRVLQYGREAFAFVRNAHINRAYAYLEKENDAAALADFNKAIEMRASKAHVFRARAAILIRMGRYQDAIADLHIAIEKQPDYAWGYRYRGRAYRMMGDWPRARSDYDQAAKLDPSMASDIQEEIGPTPP